MFTCENPDTEVAPLRVEGAAPESRSPPGLRRRGETRAGFCFSAFSKRITLRLCAESRIREVKLPPAMRHLLGLILLTFTLGNGACDGAPQANVTSDAGGAPAANRPAGANAVPTAGRVPV